MLCSDRDCKAGAIGPRVNSKAFTRWNKPRLPGDTRWRPALVPPADVPAIVTFDGSPPNEALISELKNFVKATIAPYKYPREIEFVDALPKTATGKLRRVELRSR